MFSMLSNLQAGSEDARSSSSPRLSISRLRRRQRNQASVWEEHWRLVSITRWLLLLQCTDYLAGGAGLLGGALLENAWDDHEDNEQREAYDDGAS